MMAKYDSGCLYGTTVRYGSDCCSTCELIIDGQVIKDAVIQIFIWTTGWFVGGWLAEESNGWFS